MQSERQHQWQNILQMTEQLQQLSASENWSAMIKLESCRKQKLDSFFATPVSETEAAAVAMGIQQILESDQRLVQAGRKQQKEATCAVQKLCVSKKAVKAYRHFQK